MNTICQEKKFTHITQMQRLQLKILLEEGTPKSEIARILGVNRATIYNEIKRGTVNGTYEPEYAHEKSLENKAKCGAPSIIALEPGLAELIAQLIQNEHKKPEEIIQLLQKKSYRQQYKRLPKSPHTIYDAIHKGMIPGVTIQDLKKCETTVFNNGQIHIAGWVREKLGIQDGDILSFEITDDGKLLLQKIKE